MRLEQRMMSLHVNTVRGTVTESLKGVNLKDGGASGLLEAVEGGRSESKQAVASSAAMVPPISEPLNLPFFTADFEASASPKMLAIRGVLFGSLPFQLRVIGEDDYVKDPFLGLISNAKKPWVSTTVAERTKERTSGEASVTSPAIGGSSEHAKLIALLAKAQSVVEVGPASVDGQQTTEFKAHLIVKSHNATSHRIHESMYLYLAANGLLVRTRVVAQIGRQSADATTDILATEIPVIVMPPAASETISQAELSKQEESSGGSLESSQEAPHLSKREKAEDRRLAACLRKRLPKHPSKVGKRVLRKAFRECEKIAKAGAK